MVFTIQRFRTRRRPGDTKRCEYNNKDEGNSLKTLDDKNDFIVFHANQSKKHLKKFHKKFLDKRHEMNSKRKIQWHELSLMLLISKVIYCKKQFDLAFSIIGSHIVFISIFGLLKRSIKTWTTVQKNRNQHNTYQALSQKFRQIMFHELDL